MDRSNQVDKILPKLFKIKSKMGAVSKDAKNPFFKSNYADLNSHLEMIEPLLQEHGLVMLQPVSASVTGGGDTVSTYIFDSESGQYLSSSISIQGKDMQQLGAAVTYGRRFTVGALFGMQAVDDDGNYASGKTDKLSKPETKAVVAKATPVAQINVTQANVEAPKPSFRRPTAKPKHVEDDL